MDTLSAVNSVIRDSGLTSRRVSQMMGKSESYMSAAIAQSKRKGGGFNSATLAELADVCGYKLALVPRDRVPESAVVIDPPR